MLLSAWSSPCLVVLSDCGGKSWIPLTILNTKYCGPRHFQAGSFWNMKKTGSFDVQSKSEQSGICILGFIKRHY